MEQEAMRYLNYIGNRIFALLFTWLLNQRITDTLCGTKALTKESYQGIAKNRDYFGEFDPFSDFDMNIPNLFFIISVEDNITLELDFDISVSLDVSTLIDGLSLLKKDLNNISLPEFAQQEIQNNNTNALYTNAWLCTDDEGERFDDLSTSSEETWKCFVEIEMTDDSVIVTSSGIPNHDFQSKLGCCAEENDYRWIIPTYPKFSEEITMAPDRGPIAITVTGVPIYGPEEGPGGDAVAGQEGAYEEDRQQVWLGICHGHSGPGGEYHYHADSNCVHWHPESNQTWEDYSITSSRGISEHSEIVGFAFDGYPIYGFVGWDENGVVKEMFSSYKLKEGANGYNGIDDYEYIAGLGDLDSCNGQFGTTPDYPNGTYHYHTTWENGEGGIGFPYFINCYRGELLTENSDGDEDDPCAGHGETWGPGIGPPPDGCDPGPPTMEVEPGMWYEGKMPPISGIIIFMIMCIAYISRFRLKAFSEGVPSLADTVDVCRQDPISA
jgi:hypothetical protein